MNDKVPDYEHFKNISKHRRNEKNIKKVHRMSKNYLDKFQMKFNAKENYRPNIIKRRYKEINKYHIYQKLDSDILFKNHYFPCSCFFMTDYNSQIKQIKKKQKIEYNRIKISDYYSTLNEECEEKSTFDKSFKYGNDNSSANQDSNSNPYDLFSKHSHFDLKIIRINKLGSKLKRIEDQNLTEISIENIAQNFDYVFVDKNETIESEYEFIDF